MSGSAVPGTPAPPLTRRQLREAERAAEAARQQTALEAQRVDEAARSRAAEDAVPHSRARLRAAEEAARLRAREEAATLERGAAERAAARAAGERATVERAAEEQASRARTVAERTAAEHAAAERAAAADQAQHARAAVEAAGAPAAARGAVRTAAATADTPTAADQVPTEVLTRRPPSGPPLSRRALREQSTRPAAPQRRNHGWAPRAAVLGTLGALTIFGPLTGLAGTDEAASASQTVATQANLLEQLDIAAAAALLVAPDGLLADPTAASRAAVLQASRANDRDALTCAALDGANGVRAAMADRESAVVMPVAAGAYRLTSPYGYRNSPFTGYSLHTGADLAAPLRTPIHAVADAVVEYVGVGKDGRSSMLIILKHEVDGQTVYSWYNHMYADGLFVQEGDQVRAGDVIAEVGNNGFSTGPHVHVEIHTDADGTTTDPLAWLERQGAVDVSELC